MRRPGDVHDRDDTPAGLHLQVVVISHELYRDATGMVFVCPVVPDSPATIDHPTQIACSVAGRPARVAVDELYRMPAAGLADQPVDRLPYADVERIHKVVRGVFTAKPWG